MARDEWIGQSGEVVITRQCGRVELVVDGVMLMSSVTARSSRDLAVRGLSRVRGAELVAGIGGLGLGYTLDEVRRDPRVARVTVVEIEPGIIDWHRQRGLDDAPDLVVECAHVMDWLERERGRYDLLLFDVDNGPDWLVRDDNLSLYEQRGLELVWDRLAPGGVAGFWSSRPVLEFERALALVFGEREREESRDYVNGEVSSVLYYVRAGG